MKTFAEILEKEKAKVKPQKKWHPLHAVQVHDTKKKYSRKDKHKQYYM